MCTFTLPEHYDLILIPFNAFAEMVEAEAQQAALARMRQHLAEGGRLIVTLHNPVVRLQGVDGQARLRGQFPLPEGGKTLFLFSMERYDPATRLVSGAQFYEVYGPDGVMRSKRFVALRFFLHSAETFEALARAQGFRVAELYGDYQTRGVRGGEEPVHDLGAGGCVERARRTFEVRRTGQARKLMSAQVEPTPYAEINAVLYRLLEGVQAALGERFIGLYLHGSLACGDFKLQSSDVDFLVATQREIDDEALAALAAMHANLTESGSGWARKIEGSYIPLRALRRHDPANARFPALRVDGSFGIDGHGSEWVIQRHILRQWGIALAGPDLKAWIDPVSGEDLGQAVRDTH